MMLFATDVPWWTKLWWHGVDIAANVISGILLAALAVGSWWLQQRWQRGIALKHAATDSLQRRRDRLRTLSVERHNFWKQAVRLKDDLDFRKRGGIDLLRLFSEYRAWMQKNSLQRFGDNSKRFEILMKLERGGPLDEALLAKLPEDILGTNLPDPERDLGFPW